MKVILLKEQEKKEKLKKLVMDTQKTSYYPKK
jgi:hypothetical protein